MCSMPSMRAAAKQRLAEDDILPELPGDSAFSWLASLTPSERRLFATIMAKAQPPGQPPAALSATLPPAVITAAPDPAQGSCAAPWSVSHGVFWQQQRTVIR